MRPEDRHGLVALLTGLTEATGGQPLSAAGLELYWRGLADLELADVSAAASAHLACSRFRPTVAELRERIVGRSEDRGVVAWEVVLRTMGNAGAYVSVDFEDAAVNAAIRSLGGWPRLCGLEGEARDTWARKEFLRAYQAYAGRDTGEHGAPLPGIVERGNGALYAVPEPRRIACPTAQAPAMRAPAPRARMGDGTRGPTRAGQVDLAMVLGGDR